MRNKTPPRPSPASCHRVGSGSRAGIEGFVADVPAGGPWAAATLQRGPFVATVRLPPPAREAWVVSGRFFTDSCPRKELGKERDSAAVSRSVAGIKSRRRARGKLWGAAVTMIRVLPLESQLRVRCQSSGSRSFARGDH